MSTGGMPDNDKLLEDLDEEDEAAAEGGAAEDEGREYASPGEDDGEEGSDDEGPDLAAEARPERADLGSRRSNRIRNLNRRLQDSNRRNEELERRMQALEGHAGQQQQVRRQETQEEENARMALMDPNERMQYTLDRGMHRINAMVQQAQSTQIESNDLARFRDLAATDRLARRFAPQVEELFQTLKSQGRMTAREVILNYVIGQEARKGVGSPRTRDKRREAQREISRNRGNGSSGRSDVSSERRRGGQTLEQRLEGKLI
jgi:hypothetical protein